MGLRPCGHPTANEADPHLEKILRITDGHRRLFRNPSFVLLWSGQTASYFGDAFFNLAVMWVVWSETQSTLQTDIIFAPLAGVLADRWDRKAIMVTTNVAAASVVGAVVLLVVLVGHLPPVVAFVAIFKLNGLTTFMNPARASIMPSVVGRDLLTTAQGLFSTARETAALAGSATAGLVIAAAGAVWALAVDAASFLFVSLCIAIARLPGRSAPTDASNKARAGLSQGRSAGTCEKGGGRPRDCRSCAHCYGSACSSTSPPSSARCGRPWYSSG